jgi:arylsulfatase
MYRRDFLKYSATTVGSIILSSKADHAYGACSVRKNIIFIISDQMRWDVLPCNGASFVKAPNFDRLARQSTNFTHAYSGNPICAPARGILATGCYSHRCMEPASGERIIRPHIAKVLKQHGYATYGIGKCHYNPYKKNPGFDIFEVAEEGRIEYFRRMGTLEDSSAKDDYIEYLRSVGLYGMQRAHGIGNNDIRAGRAPVPLEHYVDTWATTRSLRILEEHLKNQSDNPFFLQLGFVKPHAPYDPPAPFDQMYDPLKIPKPWGSAADLKGRNPLMVTYPHNYLIDQMSEAGIQYSRSHYFGLISYLDLQIGRVLDFLTNKGLMDNTMIVFTSDHGDNLGDHGLFFKTFMTEGATHIPLLISIPEHKNGGICEALVAQEDIAPTIYEYLGIEMPTDMDGTSLIKNMRNTTAGHNPFVVSQYGQGKELTLMIREKQYKYCFARYESTEELYDLASDPHEMKNLTSLPEYAEQLLWLRRVANDWCRASGHEEILTKDGQLTYAKFNLSEHICEPTQVLGIRPW